MSILSTQGYRRTLEQFARALDEGSEDALVIARSLGWDVFPPTLRDLEVLESARHVRPSPPHSPTRAALEQLELEVRRQRMAAAPEIDLSPRSAKMRSMAGLAQEHGVDFATLQTALAAIHHVSSLEHLGNAGLPRASLGGHFDCEFMRDSTSIARDLGHEFPDLFRALVKRGASLQGQSVGAAIDARAHESLLSVRRGGLRSRLRSLGQVHRQAMKALVDVLLERRGREEEEGRFFHENRSDGRGEELRRAGWGMPYYGAIDTTPGFVTSVWRYLSLYPDTAFLDEPVVLDEKVDLQKSIVSVREAMVNALRWIVQRMDDPAGGGFVWNERMEGGSGIANQTWMDSGNSFELEPPYVPVEVQGMAYDALVMGAELLERYPGPRGPHTQASRAAAAQLRDRAQALRTKFFDAFAIEEDGVFRGFAHAVKSNAGGDGFERSTWMKSNPGRLLDSRLFDGDDPRVLAMRDALVERLFRADMIGPFGLIRTMSSDQAEYNPLEYHNGSIWPTDNMQIAHGLLRQAEAERARGGEEGARRAADFQRKAEQLMRGILAACADAAQQGFFAPEWIPGDHGLHIPLEEKFVVDAAGNKRITELSPMKVQGWTVSAMWASASYLSDRRLFENDPGYLASADRAQKRGVPQPQEHPASR